MVASVFTRLNEPAWRPPPKGPASGGGWRGLGGPQAQAMVQALPGFGRGFLRGIDIRKGDSGANRLCCRSQSFGDLFTWCLVPHKGRFCSAREALPHRRPHAARLTLTRPILPTVGRVVTGQAQRSRALRSNTRHCQRQAGGSYSRMTGPCRVPGNHVPAAHGKRLCSRSLGTLQP